MTGDVALLLGILIVAVALFSLEWISADVVALGVLLALILTGLIAPDRAFAGFGSDSVIMILGLLIMTAALMRTGVVEITGRYLMRSIGRNPQALLTWITVSVALLSSLISNTAATAF